MSTALNITNATSSAAASNATKKDYTQIKEKQQATWASGNYALIGSTLQITGESLCEALDMKAGRNVLDVAAGNGNASLAAARRFCHVVSTDYVPELLEKGEHRAKANGMSIDYQTADAENLPFADNSFDYVLSTFGVMFAPDQDRSALELIRVCKPGGKIGMTNWTPESFIGQLFKTIGRHVPPPANLSSPANWGNENFIQERFSGQCQRIETVKKTFCFRYLSADHWLDVFRTYYGPTHKAFAALPPEQQEKLSAEILSLINRFDESNDTSMVVPSEYLEIVITR